MVTPLLLLVCLPIIYASTTFAAVSHLDTDCLPALLTYLIFTSVCCTAICSIATFLWPFSKLRTTYTLEWHTIVIIPNIETTRWPPFCACHESSSPLSYPPSQSPGQLPPPPAHRVPALLLNRNLFLLAVLHYFYFDFLCHLFGITNLRLPSPGLDASSQQPTQISWFLITAPAAPTSSCTTRSISY